MILALLACAPADKPPVGDTAVEVAPEVGAGPFTMTVAGEWVGDCDFQDAATYLAPEQEWTFDPRGAVLILYKDFWSVVSCSLEGPDFSCDDGSWSANRMEVTRLVEGSFPTSDTVAGALVVELDCAGSGCDTLVDTYGRNLEFPCRSEAAFEGTAR